MVLGLNGTRCGLIGITLLKPVENRIMIYCGRRSIIVCMGGGK